MDSRDNSPDPTVSCDDAADGPHTAGAAGLL